VVSSTVLLYSTIGEARDREAAARREQIANEHQAAVEARAQADHELIQSIKTDLNEHVTQSLENIQKTLFDYLEKLQNEDEARDIATQKAVLATAEANNQRLETLRAMVEQMQGD
jgi:cob(I)alamin adenosyltransferase